jgi:hypothetical protein
MRDVVAWKKGKYTFEPKNIEIGERERERIGMLMLEAIRLNDEPKSSSHRLGGWMGVRLGRKPARLSALIR